MLGDFNIHIDVADDSKSKRVLDLLHSFSLEQHVHSPTHVCGHTLDLVISQSSSNLCVTNTHLGELISDHFSVNLELSAQTEEHICETVVTGNIKSINIESFKRDLQNFDLIVEPKTEINELVAQYTCCLEGLLDKHTPFQTCKLRRAKKNPWYNTNIHRLRSQKRAFQRKWLKTKNDSDLQNLIQTRNALKNCIIATKKEYYQNKVKESSHNQGALFKCITTLLHRNSATPFPEDRPAQEFSNELNNLIDKIRRDFFEYADSLQFDGNEITDRLHSFTPLDAAYVTKIIKSSSNSSCLLDPIPTTLLKQCTDELVPTIVQIINKSFASSTMPDKLKHAIVVPRLKKQILSSTQKTIDPFQTSHFCQKYWSKQQ